MKTLKENRIIILTFLSVAYIASAITFEDAFFIRKAFVRHDHDGLYISHQRMLGISQAWIIEGSRIRVLQAGTESTRYINQGDNYISVNNGGTKTFFYKNEDDEFIVADNELDFLGSKIDMGIKMVLVSEETDYRIGEVMMLLDTAYGD